MVKGLKKGVAQGLEEGIRRERIIVARNLKNLGVSKETIRAATSLSIQEIEKL
jgi:predicted transposase/invertase (TIGR01784 family)